METKSINYVLFIVVFVLALNLVYPLGRAYGKLTFGDLGCEINGAYVDDANLCCHEMGRFPGCFDNKCDSDNYQIVANKQMFRYCKASGYDVRY
ncbi:MAG: hypothetical protein KKG75_00780 [Nanoarchaeota archaeon]|nr:hypothetical protein [Nanoarchaeota archaeon]